MPSKLSLCACGADMPEQWDPDWNQWRQPWQCAPCAAAAETRRREEEIAAALHASEIPERWQALSLSVYLQQRKDEPWDDFRNRLDDCPSPTLGITSWNKPAARLVRAWSPEAPGSQPGGHLMLVGPVGGGKSVLAIAGLADAIRRDSSLDGYFLPEPFLIEGLRLEVAGMRKRGLLARAATVRALVLDELGSTERVSDWHRDAIEFLLGARYNAGAPTLITSNLNLEQIKIKYGDRVQSRLVEMLGGTRKKLPGLRELTGVDWRTDMHHEKSTTEYTAEE